MSLFKWLAFRLLRVVCGVSAIFIMALVVGNYPAVGNENLILACLVSAGSLYLSYEAAFYDTAFRWIRLAQSSKNAEAQEIPEEEDNVKELFGD